MSGLPGAIAVDRAGAFGGFYERPPELTAMWFAGVTTDVVWTDA